jgi:hypothetical protein
VIKVARSQKGTRDRHKFRDKERRRAAEAGGRQAEGGTEASRGGPGEGALRAAEGASLALQRWEHLTRTAELRIAVLY